MKNTEYNFALLGNPNSGKTTLFNLLTGSSARTGNFTGVTVERREGICRFNGMNIKITDLPGIYSLSPQSAEETVTRDYIIHEKPGLILNIADASNLKRNLYLSTQIAETGIPVLLVLNMIDEAEKNGIFTDTERIYKNLGMHAVKISAVKKTGIDEMLRTAVDIAKKHESCEVFADYGKRNEEHIRKIMCEEKIPRFSVVLRLENSGEHIAERRYEFIEKALKEAVTERGSDKEDITDKTDKIVNHPLLALPIFFGVMFLVFNITFGAFGTYLSGLTDKLFNVYFADAVRILLERLGAGIFLKGLVTDGIIAGVGAAAAFLPQIMLLFLFLSVLEDTGYMARIAFIADKLFVRLGLGGKSFLPMLMGFGCSVPAIMAARTLEDERSRKLTMLLVPFMSCGAKMPVYAMFGATLFPKNGGIVIFSLYVMGIAMGILSGFIFSKTIMKGEAPPFVLEMPPYRIPSAASVLKYMAEKLREFAVRAGTVLLFASVVIWLLRSVNVHFRITPDSRDSILGVMGEMLAPLFRPCGFGTPEAAVSLISGFAAKEAIISSMSILYGMPPQQAAMNFTPLGGYAFLVFVLLYVPCIAAVSAMKTESKSMRLTLFSVLWQLITAWIVSMLVYQTGALFV